VLKRIVAEAAHAERLYGPFRSTHEGLGVLTEEYAELVEAIRSNDLAAVREEAIQLSAVAMRLAESCSNEETIKRSIP